MTVIEDLTSGNTSLGIELGSTRIKMILLDSRFQEVASGEFKWENQFIEENWTYNLREVWNGIQQCYLEVKNTVQNNYSIILNKVGSIGISAMMHGYLVFGKDEELLVPFRTWRNTSAEEASKILSNKLNYNIPARWSVSHLFQAMINKEKHINEITFMTTLAGYVHWKLTGKKVIGIGDASGMFPIDYIDKDYDVRKLDKFNKTCQEIGYDFDLVKKLPSILLAGEEAGYLTKDGANLIDPSGDLKVGIPLCPPEGDAGTGMIATNSIRPQTGNISAGTSVFSMTVLENELKNYYPEIDIVSTPNGCPVAMVHANNCTSELNEWMNLFNEVLDVNGYNVEQNELYNNILKSVTKETNSSGLLNYGYHSGENITGIDEGVILQMRSPKVKLSLDSFIQSLMYSAFGALSIGMEILYKENVKLDNVFAHGGLFKTDYIAQSIVSAAVETEVKVMKNAGEGGAWGIALLSAYMKNYNNKYSLQNFLEKKVFSEIDTIQYTASAQEIEAFKEFMHDYKKGISLLHESLEVISWR